MRQKLYALVDCNNFFVSCERVFRPDLWDKPVAVLSNNDGCIVARSNEVKQLGVPMGVPLFKVRDILEAHKVTLFSGNFRLYGDFSQRVVQLLQNASPEVEVYSVDESFLELSKLNVADYALWARELREQILRCTGIPVSIGIAPTKTLAKAASEYAKKTELTGVQCILDEATRQSLLQWLPVGEVWGIGWRTAPTLLQRGIKTAYDLTCVSDKWVQSQLSIRGLKTVKELRGEACFDITKEEPQKSIARTRSFGHNVRDYYELQGAIATFAAQAAAKLRQQKGVAGVVMVFLRAARNAGEYRGSSVAIPLLQPTADTGEIISRALEGLLQLYDADFSYKKGGVILLDLAPLEAWQLSLLHPKGQQLDRQKALMQAIDTYNQRYGARLISHGSEHLGQKRWHSLRQRQSPAYTASWKELPRINS